VQVSERGERGGEDLNDGEREESEGKGEDTKSFVNHRRVGVCEGGEDGRDHSAGDGNE
jgi:hypothetical protein